MMESRTANFSLVCAQHRFTARAPPPPPPPPPPPVLHLPLPCRRLASLAPLAVPLPSLPQQPQPWQPSAPLPHPRSALRASLHSIARCLPPPPPPPALPSLGRLRAPRPCMRARSPSLPLSRSLARRLSRGSPTPYLATLERNRIATYFVLRGCVEFLEGYMKSTPF